MPENTTHAKTWHEKTYYEFLEVSQEATLKEIKEAYRTKLLASHPDKQASNTNGVTQGQTGVIKSKLGNTIPQLKEAYKILSDPELRQRYDEELIELFGKNGIVNNGEGLDTYTLDDFEEVEDENDEIYWVRDCPRCTSCKSFELTEDDLINSGTKISGNSEIGDGIDKVAGNDGEGRYELIVQCNSCSLWIRVRYYDLDEVTQE